MNMYTELYPQSNECRRAESLDGLWHLFGGMATVQETEPRIIEGLCTHRDAIDWELLQHSGKLDGDVVRIYLDGNLRFSPGPSLYGGE